MKRTKIKERYFLILGTSLKIITLALQISCCPSIQKKKKKKRALAQNPNKKISPHT
jgi:hypothetical protein